MGSNEPEGGEEAEFTERPLCAGYFLESCLWSQMAWVESPLHHLRAFEAWESESHGASKTMTSKSINMIIHWL